MLHLSRFCLFKLVFVEYQVVALAAKQNCGLDIFSFVLSEIDSDLFKYISIGKRIALTLSLIDEEICNFG